MKETVMSEVYSGLDSNIASENDFVDCWDVMHYTTDKKGRTNYLRIGRAWAKDDSDAINIKLYAAPFTNRDGECWLTLVPYDPEWKKK
jgi:hypothetical protein